MATTNFNTLNSEGIDFTQVFQLNTATPEYPNAPFAAGTIAEGSGGSEFVYCQGTTAITANGVVQIDSTFTATALANSATVAFGQIAGVCPNAVTAIAGTITKNFFWVQRKGVASVLTAAAAVTFTQLRSTATAGAVDDVVAGATTYPITGMVLTQTATGAGSFTGMLNYPTLGTLNT